MTVHPTKTRIVQVQSEGFDFLGWHFGGKKKWPRKKSLQKLQDKLRPLTRRTRGWSLGAIVAKVNPILRGWRRLLPGKPPHGPERSGRVAAASPAGDAAQAGEATGLRAERSRR